MIKKDNQIRQGLGVGSGVDMFGGPVIDPTKNVLDLVNASIKRIDDMASVQELLTTEKIRRIEELTNNRAEFNFQMGALRASHQVALDEQESKRLDAVRLIDQLAVKTESDRASLAITALATTASNTAEILRNAVNTSATTLATQLDRMMSATTERIAALEKSSYTGAGKQAIADPQIERLSVLVENLALSNSQRTGKTEGISTSMAVVVVVITMILSSLGMYVMRTPNVPVSTAQPQIIYMPAPSGTMIPSPPTARNQ